MNSFHLKIAFGSTLTFCSIFSLKVDEICKSIAKYEGTVIDLRRQAEELIALIPSQKDQVYLVDWSRLKPLTRVTWLMHYGERGSHLVNLTNQQRLSDKIIHMVVRR